jgi:hypothetical protein
LKFAAFGKASLGAKTSSDVHSCAPRKNFWQSGMKGRAVEPRGKAFPLLRKQQALEKKTALV